MTSRDEHRGPDDSIGRVDRIEISRDVAIYLAAAIETLAEHRLRNGEPLPARLIDIQQKFDECARNSRPTSPIHANQPDQTHAGVSEQDKSLRPQGSSEPSIVDTAAAARMLGLRRDSVRDLCRRKRLDAVPIGGRYVIAVASIEKYKPKGTI